MKNVKTPEQLASIYGFKIIRYLKSKNLTDREINYIIEQLHAALQYQNWRSHFREHPNELFDS